MNPSQPRSLRVTLAEHGPGGARAGGDAPPLLQVTVGTPGSPKPVPPARAAQIFLLEPPPASETLAPEPFFGFEWP